MTGCHEDRQVHTGTWDKNRPVLNSIHISEMISWNHVVLLIFRNYIMFPSILSTALTKKHRSQYTAEVDLKGFARLLRDALPKKRR